MNSQVLLVAGIFLDFGSALILIVPIVRFSIITSNISRMQQTIFRFGLITFNHTRNRETARDRETTRVQNDILFDLDQNLQEMESITQQTRRYEKELFPYGIVFLGIGFVLIILGTMMNQ